MMDSMNGWAPAQSTWRRVELAQFDNALASSLTPREEVLRLAFGIGMTGRPTVSHARIRQIEAKA
jgi:hypothetical protein